MEPVETRHNPSRPVETRQNPFRPVQTRRNPFRSVQTRSNTFQSVQTPFKPVENTFKPVETRYNPFKRVSPPPSPLPLLPLFPFLFFWGGGRGGEATTTTAPRKGGGRSPPPLLRILTKNYQNSLTLSSLCVIYPRGFSQSTAAQNYINTYGGGLSTKNKIHCGILQKINIIFIIYPPK